MAHTNERAVTWEPPGPGQWYAVLDHMPKPVSRLFVELFPMMAIGWPQGAKAYGLPSAIRPQWGVVNCWFFYGGVPEVAEVEDLEAVDLVAKETLETQRWRDESRVWHEVERPAVVAGNLALQGEPVADLDDVALADHLLRAVVHYREFAPLHFSHQGGAYAVGSLLGACREWGLAVDDVLPLFTGAATATSSARAHVDAIARELRRAGVAAGEVASLDDVRAASAGAADALDEYVRMHGHRLVENRDLVDPTLIERPQLIVKTIVAALARDESATSVAAVDVDAVRDRVPASERERFDGLLADARATWGLGDDDEGVCFLWPLGLVRRAVLEAGRRLAARGRVRGATDLLDATTDEIDALLRDPAGDGAPSAEELARRADERVAAASLVPPAVVGEPVPDAPAPPPDDELPPHVAQLIALTRHGWAGHGAGSDPEALTGLGIGSEVYRGRACCVTDSIEALDRIEPGDVLVAVATNPGFNAVFPMIGAAVTQEGGMRSHAALLSRELGIPAVVGVGGIRKIRDGDLVEVDPVRGVVTVVERSPAV